MLHHKYVPLFDVELTDVALFNFELLNVSRFEFILFVAALFKATLFYCYAISYFGINVARF